MTISLKSGGGGRGDSPEIVELGALHKRAGEKQCLRPARDGSATPLCPCSGDGRVEIAKWPIRPPRLPLAQGCPGGSWEVNMSKKGGVKLAIRPVTPDLWLALADLFGKWGASNGCWCMYWRLGGAYRGRSEGNKETLRRFVTRGPPPGLLAFDGDLPVGWGQLT